MLGATLLSDWVFTQNPKSVQVVVGLILDGIGLRYLVAAGSAGRRRRGIWNPVVLPPKCGNDQLVSACFDILAKTPPFDYAVAVIELLRANSPVKDLIVRWKNYFDRSKRLIWLNYGVHLGVLSVIELSEVEQSVGADNENAAHILYRARRLDFFESSEQRFDLAVRAILTGDLRPQPQRRVESAIDALAQALNITRYGIAFRERVPVPLSKLFAQHHGLSTFKWSPDLATNTEAYKEHKNCLAVAAIAEEESNRTAAEWATELEPWSRVVETGRERWGDQWALYCLANLAAGVRSTQERCKEAGELLDHSRSLCPRARHARLRSRNRSWWQGQFRNALSDSDRVFVCLVALSWARPEVLVSLVEVLDKCLGRMSNERWLRLIRAVERTISRGYSRADERVSGFGIDALPGEISARTVVALATRASTDTARNLYSRYLARVKPGDSGVLEFVMDQAADSARFGAKEWSPDLDRIRECYLAGAGGVGFPFTARRERRGMPIETASAIAGNPSLYPTTLLEIAEEVCRRNVARKTRPVASVAEDEGWFGQQRPGRLF